METSALYPPLDVIIHPGRNFQTVAAEVLQDTPGTPYSFLNEGSLRETVGLFRDHFLPTPQYDTPSYLGYSVKARPDWYTLRVLWDEGITHFDCASWGEIRYVQEINPQSVIMFNHPIKRLPHINESLRNGVRHFTAQDLEEINTILTAAAEYPSLKPLEIAVRLQTWNGRARMNLSKKFGIPAPKAQKLISYIHKNSSALPGISMHVGSQNTDPQVHVRGIREMASIAQAGGGVHSFNIGGGLPVAYHPGESFDAREYLTLISRAITEHIDKAILSRGIILSEFGRSIAATGMISVFPVLKVYRNAAGNITEAHFAGGIFSDCIDSVIHPGWRYHFEALGRNGRQLTGTDVPVTLYGQTCDDGDVLPYQVPLPADLQSGDYLVMPNAGAYGSLTLGSPFCGFSLPKYVVYNSSFANTAQLPLEEHTTMAPANY